MVLASCHISGVQNYEVAPKLSEDLCTPDDADHLHDHPPPPP